MAFYFVDAVDLCQLGHHLVEGDLIFPALHNFRREFPGEEGVGSGCEKACVNWNVLMSTSSMSTFMNRVVHCMHLDRSFMDRDPRLLRAFGTILLTTHTFRRGYAQFKFFHEDPEKRWLLSMLKWWAGWSENESCDVIMKYLLDSSYVAEDEILADAMAPDRAEKMKGCPRNWDVLTRDPLREMMDSSASAAAKYELKVAYEDKLNAMEERMKAYIRDQIKEAVSDIASTKGFSEARRRTVVIASATPPLPLSGHPSIIPPTGPNGTYITKLVASILPPACDWASLLRFYFYKDPSRKFYRSVEDFTPEDVAANQPSRLSKCRTLARQFKTFRHSRLCLSPLDFEAQLTQFGASLEKTRGGPIKSIDIAISTAKQLCSKL